MAFACPGCSGWRDWNDASARMWSSSFAGSICARTSAIGVGVGLGVLVGRAAAVAAMDALGVAADGPGDDEELNTRPGMTASQATITTSSSAARALIVLG